MMILRFLPKNFQLDLFLFLHFLNQDKQLCVVENMLLVNFWHMLFFLVTR